MKWINLIIVFLILAIPFASAEEPAQYEITKTIKISRGSGNTTLNLSDPQSIKQYSPAYRFWNENLTGPGKIVDGILPPDTIRPNSTDLELSWQFRLSPQEIADGVSHFILRLPISFNSTNYNLNISIDRIGGHVLQFNNEGNTLNLIKTQTINYANLTLHLYYIDLYGLIFPDEIYTLNISISHIQDPIVLVYSYDYLDDNLTSFTLNGHNYSADLAVGFEFKQLTSNGITGLPIAVAGSYYQKISLQQSYNGEMYISFAYEIYSLANTTIAFYFTNNEGSNHTLINIVRGFNTVRGQVRLNFAGENWVNIEIDSSTGFYLIVNGYSEYPATGNINELGINYNLKTWIRPYGDIVVNSEEYYTPGAVILPGNWIESMKLAIKYAPPAYLPLILTQAVYHTAIYTILKVMASFSYILYKGMDFIAGIIKSLINRITALFNWIYTTVVHWFISNVGWWIWAFLEGLWFLLQISIFVIAVWIVDSFLRGIIVLPDRGIKGMVQEWSGVTSFVENVGSKAKSLIGWWKP